MTGIVHCGTSTLLDKRCDAFLLDDKGVRCSDLLGVVGLEDVSFLEGDELAAEFGAPSLSDLSLAFVLALS